jgi:CSLREA domain-containing protein
MGRRFRVLVLLAIFVCFLGSMAHASTFTVTKTMDTADGVCDADCSLREAAMAVKDIDTIVIPSGTYRLNSQIELPPYVTLQGAGPRLTIIDGNGADRIFKIGLNPGSIFLQGMTLRNGQTSGNGGAIDNENEFGGWLTISDCDIEGNEAQQGGAIYIADGSLNLTRTAVVNNRAVEGEGGGILLGSPDDDGFAYRNECKIVNSTIGSNTAASSGGGISINAHDYYGQVLLENTTVANNTAKSGGGISSKGRIVYIDVADTIVSGNTTENCEGADGTQFFGRSSIASDGSCGPCESVADPLLGPLQDNGGPTPTFALLAGSPAIDAANALDCPAVDQRGYGRPVDGNGDGKASCDIGAYEFNASAPVVNEKLTKYKSEPLRLWHRKIFGFLRP